MLFASLSFVACGGGSDEPAKGTTSNVPDKPAEPEEEKGQDTKSSKAADTASEESEDSSSDIRAKVESAFQDMVCLTQKGDAKAAKKAYKKHGFKNRKDFDRKWSHYAKMDKKWADDLAKKAMAKGACK